MRIRRHGQVVIVPFIGDERQHLCFSANNASKTKSVIINEMNGLTRRDISHLNAFGQSVRDTLQKLRDAHMRVGDDAYFFHYNADGGKLQLFIGDFHDIVLGDQTMMGKNYRHNHNMLEFAYQQLLDDGVIDEGLYNQLCADLYNLHDY